MLEEEYQPRRQLPRALRPKPRPEQPFSYDILPALLADLPAVRDVYNLYVANSTVTFDARPKSMGEWKTVFARSTQLRLPFLVAVSPAGTLLGYAHVEPWSGRGVNRTVVELSIYLGPASTGKGLGRELLAALLAACEEVGIRQVIAVIADQGAEASIRLHASFGFVEIGRMGRVGFKFDRWLGTVTMQKTLKKRSRRRD
ncbi:phosphinothricin acetyltransferase [Frondihabitans sp. PAMC 28766]|uniref:GNAT family N-acetyltransferase n=1 Tax=Frondihabitans sp. PAMC 28766 TaxID=1795630 RepID=UPI00078E5123|nr:GNAT family N-acetyltransferase [Frondihabitans sp. PAMC 28766]AMM21200.1 phosphinothricin acetyltransferase [Frondihabitans sp. PAMC 28766]